MAWHQAILLLGLAWTPLAPQVHEPAHSGAEPALDRPAELSGPAGDLIGRVAENWVAHAPRGNPAMLAMFRDRDVVPYRDLLPWSGEFVGKHLTGACQLSDITGSPTRDLILGSLRATVNTLLSYQDEDGYLGPFPRGSRLTGLAPNIGGKEGPTWDAWGHYHVALGLMLYYDRTGDQAALNAARRIGDLFCNRFLGAMPPARLVDNGSTELNHYRLEAGRFAENRELRTEVLRSRFAHLEVVATIVRLRPLLLPDVLHDRLVRHVTARRHEVPPRPQVAPPVLLLKMPELHQQLPPRLPLDVLHDLAGRQVRRTREQGVDMVV